ncbi:MAG: type II toxin-antitoxin system VapC family toxin [Roseococcus sp.]
MTGFLADACALIDFHGPGPRGMARGAAEIMSSGEIEVAAVTVWEIQRKVAMGRLMRPVPPGFVGEFPDWLGSCGYRLAPMSWEDAALAATLPEHHRDPMDRFLIATALRRDMTIITGDAIFRAYGVPTLW